ncbi:MAG: GGDEF domain-containing protein [Lachnospira sp.]|nr:GGDEF domain-containing protein [Lachnospira sp.]
MSDKNSIRARAVINEQYNIESLDDDFRTFLGADGTHRLTYYVHPNDIERLDDAVYTATMDKETVVALRMVNGEKVYRWVLAVIKSYAGSEDGSRGGGLLRIELQDVSIYNEEIDSIESKYDRYMEYFSLMEQLMFSYDVNSGKLRIFMMGSHQQINFYNGTLENWKQSKLANGEVDGKSLNIFEQLCEDIRTGADSFEHELNMCVMEANNKMEWCLIKGKTIKAINGKRHVIATMSLVNAVSDASSNSMLSGTKDAGTDMLNKRAITSYVQRILDDKPNYPVTIAIIDIDNFKDVNDKYGHMVGDEIIRNVADVVKEAVEGKGVAGRIGGDEMMIMLEDFETEETIRTVLRTIRNNVSWLYNSREDRPHVTCSIGAASYPDDASNYDELFNVADKMLYLAKEKGRNRYIIYHNDMHGDYLHGTGKARTDEYLLYKHKKLRTINSIVNLYSAKGSEALPECAQKTILAFGLDSILLYEKNAPEDWSRYTIYGENVPQQACLFMERDNYIADFTDEGVRPIDNICFFERKARTAFEEFSGIGVCQAVQVLVKEYEGKQRVISFNRNTQLKKWSDSDIMQLAILGNIFGMGYKND